MYLNAMTLALGERDESHVFRKRSWAVATRYAELEWHGHTDHRRVLGLLPGAEGRDAHLTVLSDCNTNPKSCVTSAAECGLKEMKD
jgi:hypothetical protein